MTEEETERALERTLVAVGVLLLPFGQLEIEPAFTYTRRDFDPYGFRYPRTARARNPPQRIPAEHLGACWPPVGRSTGVGSPYNVVQQDRHLDFLRRITGTFADRHRARYRRPVGWYRQDRLSGKGLATRPDRPLQLGYGDGSDGGERCPAGQRIQRDHRSTHRAQAPGSPRLLRLSLLPESV